MKGAPMKGSPVKGAPMKGSPMKGGPVKTRTPVVEYSILIGIVLLAWVVYLSAGR